MKCALFISASLVGVAATRLSVKPKAVDVPSKKASLLTTGTGVQMKSMARYMNSVRAAVQKAASQKGMSYAEYDGDDDDMVSHTPIEKHDISYILYW